MAAAAARWWKSVLAAIGVVGQRHCEICGDCDGGEGFMSQLS